jgi:hypothetical protein
VAIFHTTNKRTAMKIHIIVLLILITGQTFGQTSLKVIFFYKPYTDSSETNLYRDTLVKFDFKTQYENIKNADIKKEVEIALLHNDFRIVGISGVSYLFPGRDSRYESYIKKHSFKVIKGTSDSINEDEPPLQNVAYEYAKKYNLLLLEKMRTNK